MKLLTVVVVALVALAGCSGEVEETVPSPKQPCGACYQERMEGMAPVTTNPAAPQKQLVTQQPVDKEVPCAPGKEVELSFIISSSVMKSGASDEGGEGLCTALVTFNEDGAVSPGKGFEGYNGFSKCTAEDPMRPHCGTLTYPSGKVEKRHCDLFAICENGLAHAVGFSW